MSNFLKLNSADSSVKRVIIDQDHLESVFEFDGDIDQSKIEHLIDAMEKDIIKWGIKVNKVIAKSKSKIAQDLVDEFEQLYDQFVEDMQEEEEDIKKYTVLKCLSGNSYTVIETLDEIEIKMEENNYKEKFGL